MQLDHERVRWHRDRLGWTLDTLAEKAEVAKGTVLRAEHGEDVRPSSGRRIARALGTEISDLIPDKPRRAVELAGTGKAEAPQTGPAVPDEARADGPQEGRTIRIEVTDTAGITDTVAVSVRKVRMVMEAVAAKEMSIDEAVDRLLAA
jgi:transcriptional regulator with XRE-family HTH domain